MAQAEIKGWLAYWQAARMVNLDAIAAFDHVVQARKFCRCMSVGVFLDVTDLAIWRALENLRRDRSLAA